MQIDIPFFAYILRDTYTLSNYDSGKADLTSVIVMQQSYQDIMTGYIYALTDYYTDWIDFLREVNNEDFDLTGENL